MRRVLILAVVMAVAMFGGTVFADDDEDEGLDATSTELLRVVAVDGSDYLQVAVEGDGEDSIGIINAIYGGDSVTTTDVVYAVLADEVGDHADDIEDAGGEVDHDGYAHLAVFADGVAVYIYDDTPGLTQADLYVDGELAHSYPVVASFDITSAGSLKEALGGLTGDVGGISDTLDSTTSRATVALVLALIIGFALIMWLESRGSGDQPSTEIEREAG